MPKSNSLPLKDLALPLLATFCVIASCNARRENAKELERLATADTAALINETTPDRMPTADADTTLTPQVMSAQRRIPPQVNIPGPQEFLLVRDASIDLSVNDMSVAAAKVRLWIAKTGGYYSDWTRGQQGDQLSLNLTARIPAVAYDAFIDSAEQLGTLQREHAGASDLMDKLYADLEQRALHHKISGRYEQPGQKLQKGTDLLSAQDQYAARQESENDATVRIMQTRREAAMTSVQLQLVQPHAIVIIGPGFFSKLGANFRDGLHNLENLVLVLVGAWPWILLIVLIFLGIRPLLARDTAPRPRSGHEETHSTIEN